MRRKARELAFKVLFEHLVGGVPLADAWQHALELEDPPPDDATRAFAERLVDGFLRHREEVDRALAETVEGWSFAQMNQTDLVILRLATYEALFEATPFPPLAEVAVKIAKRYGGEDSGRFVNGVLARLFQRIEAGEVRAVPKRG